ncbi:MAG TPA: uracil-DNA glycosylase [Acidisarcina sp.]
MPPQSSQNAQNFDPELEQAIRARIQYCRDLGVYDFYRRGEPVPAAMSNPVPDTFADPPATQTEDSDIAVRKIMPAPPAVGPAVPVAARADALRVIREEIGECTRCPLAFAGRNKIVFGDGDPGARLMFVGEGPGADEDKTGIPFVGKAGQLLNNMINAMGLQREQVYIANIVKCRPPSNRVPEPEEAHTCTQFLFRQIDVVRPEVIVALGSTAVTYLMGAKSALGALRGRVHPWRDAKLIVTYHPAFLLRDPNQKKAAWADLQIAMAELGLQSPTRPTP